MKQRFTEAQLIKLLQEAKGGLRVKAVCRKYAIASATYYRWKNKFDGLTLSAARRLKTLEIEHKQQSAQSMPACGHTQISSSLRLCKAR